ncbi:MAG: rod shape-determining protein MreC, partial [Candidatus Omnitrophica bacterium]|nr:rod shape-determining protein MreC [Candidatus Omnitrophota bacterium]
MAKSNKNFLFAVVLVSVVSFIILSQIFSKDICIKILNIFRTPLKLISGSHYALRDVSNYKKMLNENKILKENIDNLENRLLQLHEAGFENIRLRGLLGFRESEKRRFVPAMVIARDPTGLGNTIVIDKGKNNDIHKDMVVISGNGLVGRVRECGWSISRVLLISDRDSVVGAT